ncbi:MAG: glycosyltransferase family 2 protein [Blastocatellia bacterium]
MIQPNNNADVSVVVPVYNGVATIARTVECLLNQTLTPTEIIIIDDGSTDETAEVLQQFGKRISYQFKQNGGPASARNLGVTLARGSFVTFTDSDCLPDRDWLRWLVAGFDSDEIAGAGGSVKSVDDSLIGEYVDLLRLMEPAENQSGEIEYLITANACFRRDALLAVGLFDERFRKPGGEEPALCRRIRELGYEFRFAAEAVVLHHHRQTVGSFWRTFQNYGEGRFRLGQLWPDYQIQNPARTLFRQMIAVRSLARQFHAYARNLGIKKAALFALLDYLRQLAFLWGYLRGEKA